MSSTCMGHASELEVSFISGDRLLVGISGRGQEGGLGVAAIVKMAGVTAGNASAGMWPGS